MCNDYRLCNDGVWQTLMACRLGSTVPPPAGLTTLVWSGAQPPWWFTDAESTVKWHMPSEEEAEEEGEGREIHGHSINFNSFEVGCHMRRHCDIGKKRPCKDLDHFPA